MRAIEAAGAAAHQARLDARMKALDELIDRLERDKTYPADPVATESTVPPMDSSSVLASPPLGSKAAKLDNVTTPNTAADTSKVMTELTVENQALRNAVQDMANVVSSVMSNNLDLRVNRNQLHDSIFHKAMKLPADYHDIFLNAFANTTMDFTKSQRIDEQAKMSMYAVRAKLIEMGYGGLLTAWDRDFCSATNG